MSKYQFPVTTWQEVVQTSKKMSNGVVICEWKAGIEFKNIKTQKLTKVIEKVVFNLHETFEKPTQAVTVAENGRYSIAEEGYGSFPITEIWKVKIVDLLKEKKSEKLYVYLVWGAYR